jgi:hypothetical protein
MHQRLGVTLGVAIAAALIAAGCGSSSSSSTTTTALSKSEFLSKANAICKQGTKTLTAGQESLGKNSSQAQINNYVTSTFIPSVQSQIDQVRALGAPAGDEAKVKSMLALAQADLDKIKSNPSLAVGKADQFSNFAAVAHPYGMTSCAPNS